VTIVDMISRRHGHHLAIPAGRRSEEGAFAVVAYDRLRRRA
jgi:hypothetical protein